MTGCKNLNVFLYIKLNLNFRKHFFFRMPWLFFASHLSPSPYFVFFSSFFPYLIQNPTKFLFVGLPSGFDSIQSWLAHCLGIIDAIKNNRRTNHMAVEQIKNGFCISSIIYNVDVDCRLICNGGWLFFMTEPARIRGDSLDLATTFLAALEFRISTRTSKD